MLKNGNGESMKQKKITSLSNFTYSIQIRDQIPVLNFWTKLTQNRCFQSKKWKTTTTTKLTKKKKKKKITKPIHHIHIKISVSSKF